MSPVKGGVTHFESEKPASRQSARYFSSLFFQSIFFSSVSPNALAICWRLLRGQQTSVCRQTPSASPLSLFPPTLSPIGPQTGLCESHQLHQRPRLCSNTPPPPTLHSRPGHLPLTSTSHCPSLCSQPTPQKPVSLAVWLKLGVQPIISIYYTDW